MTRAAGLAAVINNTIQSGGRGISVADAIHLLIVGKNAVLSKQYELLFRVAAKLCKSTLNLILPRRVVIRVPQVDKECVQWTKSKYVKAIRTISAPLALKLWLPEAPSVIPLPFRSITSYARRGKPARSPYFLACILSESLRGDTLGAEKIEAFARAEGDIIREDHE